MNYCKQIPFWLTSFCMLVNMYVNVYILYVYSLVEPVERRLKRVDVSSRSVPKFMKRMKVPDYKDKNVFGVPLIVHVQRSGQPLPLGLQQALRYLRSQCLDQVSRCAHTLRFHTTCIFTYDLMCIMLCKVSKHND